MSSEGGMERFQSKPRGAHLQAYAVFCACPADGSGCVDTGACRCKKRSEYCNRNCMCGQKCEHLKKSHENCHQNLFWTYKALYCCSSTPVWTKSSYTSHRYCINNTFRCLVHNVFGWSGEACPLAHHQSKPGPFLGFPNAYAKRSHVSTCNALARRNYGLGSW